MVRIKLYASSVSAACGMNKYRTSEEVSEEIMQRMFPKYIPREPSIFMGLSNDDLHKLADSSGCLLSGDVVGDVENCVETFGIMCSGVSLEKCNARERELKETLCSGISNQDLREKLEAVISSAIATGRGTKSEKSDLDAFSENVSHRGRRYAKELMISDHITLEIVGKVDGQLGDDHVVETKCRRHRLFGKIPLYEKIQLETYMWLTNTLSCTHIENFEGESNVTVYERDLELWGRVLGGLRVFSDLMRKKSDESSREVVVVPV